MICLGVWKYAYQHMGTVCVGSLTRRKVIRCNLNKTRQISYLTFDVTQPVRADWRLTGVIVNLCLQTDEFGRPSALRDMASEEHPNFIVHTTWIGKWGSQSGGATCGKDTDEEQLES